MKLATFPFVGLFMLAACGDSPSIRDERQADEYVADEALFTSDEIAELRERISAHSTAADDAGDVTVIVSSQPTEGYSEDDFDSSFLQNFESYTLERSLELIGSALGQDSVADNLIETESNFLRTPTHKLAVVRLRQGGFTPDLTVMGVVGDEFIRVGCISKTLQDVKLSQGKCYDRLVQEFGPIFD